MKKNKFKKLDQKVEALTGLEITVESGIENCLSEGCDFNNIKKAIVELIQKYEVEISGAKFRERIREHNKRVGLMNKNKEDIS